MPTRPPSSPRTVLTRAARVTVFALVTASGCGSSASTPTNPMGAVPTDGGVRDIPLAPTDGSGAYMPGPNTRTYNAPTCGDLMAAVQDVTDADAGTVYPGDLCDRGNNLTPRYASIEDCFREAAGGTAGSCLPRTLPASVDPFDGPAVTCATWHLYTYDQIDGLRTPDHCDGGM